MQCSTFLLANEPQNQRIGIGDTKWTLRMNFPTLIVYLTMLSSKGHFSSRQLCGICSFVNEITCHPQVGLPVSRVDNQTPVLADLSLDVRSLVELLVGAGLMCTFSSRTADSITFLKLLSTLRHFSFLFLISILFLLPVWGDQILPKHIINLMYVLT